MKLIFAAILTASISIVSCSKKEESKSTTQADYAKTHDEQISNPTKDSNYIDTTVAKGGQTGMQKDTLHKLPQTRK